MNSPRSFRTTELAKEFARQGHSVTVLTPKKEEHFLFEKEYGLEIKDLGELTWRIRKGKSILVRIINRVLKLLFEYPDVGWAWKVKNKIKKESGYDLLISIAVPHPVHWGVALTRSDSNPIAKIWIADCGDPYMGAENDTFKPLFYFAWVEKWFCRKANFISVPAVSAIDAYYKAFHAKVIVIPQGFRFEDVKVPPFKPNFPVRFAYAGALIPGRRDPKDFFEFLINSDKDFQFLIYTQSSHLVENYAARSNGRIILKKTLPRLKLLEELSLCDFVVNFENVGATQVPSKLIDYTIIGKPILSISSQYFNMEVANEFINNNFSNSMKVDDPDQYRIENIAGKFLCR